MYLSKICLNSSRLAIQWAANPYRIHQRLKIACEGDPRLLFRVEETDPIVKILVQSHHEPDWQLAFSRFPVLLKEVEYRHFEPRLSAGGRYRFRLLANPTVKKTVKESDQDRKTRLGLLKEPEQLAWLQRKLSDCGAKLNEYLIIPRGLQYSHKNPSKDSARQTHLAVLYEGILEVLEPEKLLKALETGIGPAKGYGFGLLSLARA